MLPEKTYILRFTHRDSSEIEEQEYTHKADGWLYYNAFAEPDSAELYTRIELTEYDWRTREEHTLAALEFASTRYTPSCTAGDYGPGNPWNAPGMSIRDFI